MNEPGAFRATRGLAWLAGFGAFGLSLSALYATTGIGLLCPSRALTGWLCPLCGGTRLGGFLLRGDLAAAFAANPVLLVALAVLGVLGVLWTVESLGGPAVRLPRAAAAATARITPTAWLVAGLAAAAVYTLLRNLP